MHAIHCYDAYPFFSLHFNESAAMYPVLHPCYEGTVVGHVIGMLDFLMKGFLNGGVFEPKYVAEWSAMGEVRPLDRDSLMPHVIDIKKMLAKLGGGLSDQYLPLRQLLSSANLDGETAEGRARYQTSFRIIANQKSIQREGGLFVLDPHFACKYTIGATPEYQRELDEHVAKFGTIPETHERVVTLYKMAADQVQRIHCWLMVNF